MLIHAGAQLRNMPLQGTAGRRTLCAISQVVAVKENARPVCASPTESIQPTIEAKLYIPIAKIIESAMAAYLGGVVPTCFVVRAIVQKATQLVNEKLACNVVDHADRDIVEVFKKRSQEPRRTELNRKTESAVITAM